MAIDFTQPWRPTHRIRIADPNQADDTVMLWADETGSGPAYTQREWEVMLEDPGRPHLWSCIKGEWLVLRRAAEVVDGQREFWGEPV